MIVFFIVLFAVIMYSIIEVEHDYHVKSDIDTRVRVKANQVHSEKWHLFGFFQNALYIIACCFTPIYTDPSTGIPLFIFMVFLFWQLHDSLLGYKFGEGIFYLGITGFDKKLRRIFYNGLTLSVYRSVFMVCSAFEYFRNV